MKETVCDVLDNDTKKKFICGAVEGMQITQIIVICRVNHLSAILNFEIFLKDLVYKYIEYRLPLYVKFNNISK